MKVCLGCGDEFEPTAAKSLFCKASCRQKNYRERKANEISALIKNAGLTHPDEEKIEKEPEIKPTKLEYIQYLEQEIEKLEQELASLGLGYAADIRRKFLDKYIPQLKKAKYEAEH